MKAFFLALVLFLGTVMGSSAYVWSHLGRHPQEYALWPSEDKSRSYEGLTRNMTDQTLPVFGSSEFMHGTDTPFHPIQVFAGSDLTPMLIGAGYYQCLSHAVTLAAIEDSMKMRKAVLILSPQWFRKHGVVDQAYTSRFSEVLYGKMLRNPDLSQDTKDYIAQRTRILLSPDGATLERVQREEQLVLGELHGSEAFFQSLWDRLLREKDGFSIFVKERLGLPRLPRREGEKIDWEGLYALAQEKGEAENTNQFYITDEAYKRLEKVLPLKKGMNADADKGYQRGPEFDDLACFLTICQETGITPGIVLMPVNGYYYDYTEFPASARAGYYKKIKKLAKKYDADLMDLSGEEYTPYFFEDRVHLGKTGWVRVEEEIYHFAGKGE